METAEGIEPKYLIPSLFKERIRNPLRVRQPKMKTPAAIQLSGHLFAITYQPCDR
jgi:hypothetical protein